MTKLLEQIQSDIQNLTPEEREILLLSLAQVTRGADLAPGEKECIDAILLERAEGPFIPLDVDQLARDVDAGVLRLEQEHA